MPDQIWALILFALIATGSPGGATALATASGARFGYRQSLPLIFGIAIALALLVAVSGTSLTAMLQSTPFLNSAIRAFGSAYLVWLALKIGLAGSPSATRLSGTKPMSFLVGSALLLVNPKAWAMAVGVASSFSNIVSDPILLGSILATVFLLCASASLSLWVLVGGVIAHSMRTDRHWHIFNGAMALLLLISILQLWI
ncbi:LysE family translocator [Ruegeria sp. SCPT10]|uniref:LysE family translocator n=1 Tax=Ruegeria sp. SCP10 TaxID=3141377 RepID=UPI0033395A2A